MLRNRIKYKALKWAALCYLVSLHLITAILIVKPDVIPQFKAKLGMNLPAPDPHFINMLRFHSLMDESIPSSATIFLGDSITQGLATAAVSPFSINLGIGGENTEQLLGAIPTYKSLYRAKTIVLTIGINDIYQGAKVGMNVRLQKIADALPSNIPLIWNAVMPAYRKEIDLIDIIETNQTIQKLCSIRDRCTFVDTWKLFTRKNGEIDAQLFLEDGIHLNSEGYRLWIATLKQAMGETN